MKPLYHCCKCGLISTKARDFIAVDVVTDEMVTAAMRAFERMSSVLRYREKDKWHSCDVMGMRDAIRAALAAHYGVSLTNGERQ